MSGEDTPLNKQLDGLARLIGVVGLVLAAMTFIVLFFKGIHTGDTVFTEIQEYSTTSNTYAESRLHIHPHG